MINSLAIGEKIVAADSSKELAYVCHVNNDGATFR